MNPTDATARSDARISAEAAEWFVEFRTGEPDLAARAEFDKWLRMSPEHLRAYLDMLPVWDDAALAGIGGNLTAEEIVARTRDAASVVPLELRDSAKPVHAPATVSRRGWMVAASVLFACFAGAALWWQSERAPIYSTAVGEQRSITLSDGSTVELNSRSRVRVHFTREERGIELLEGQALFHVAKNPGRPFIVRSEATRVRAVGTQFDVYRRAHTTIVTVLEGRVAVLPPDEPEFTTAMPASAAQPSATTPAHSASLELAAGEQVTVTPNDVQRPASADVAAATAWRQRELIFNSTALVQVAEEFNRYNTRRLVIADEALADFHVTGVFSSTDPTSLLRFLRLQPGIRVQESSAEIRISAE